MQGLKRHTIGVAGLVTALLLAPAHSAFAGGPIDKGTTTTARENSRKDDTLYAAVSYDTSKNGSGPSVGHVSTAGTSWTPPACWLAPKWTAKQFAKQMESEYKNVTTDPDQPNYAKNATSQLREMYKNGEYKNYNLDKQDEGMWWGAVENPNAPILERTACNSTLPFWAKNGESPKVKNAISPEILAGLAREQIKVPGTEVTLAPSGTTKVNLATWAWLDHGDFKPVSVTASITAPGLDIRATTVATPVSLKLQPGTEDAETYPTSGECTFNSDGSIGEPYATGRAGQTPPCGIKYLRSSAGGAYKLQATVTWEITWTGSGNTTGRMPNGTFGNDQDVRVQEAQAVNH
ncbi:hypothetical protein ACFY6U_29995 [Streptomyces sp. NPDC013157]|uniref:hypothetical protein n=1 Tax=Streptomyces sp. NPDC013157 TaxID=3364861 RepID=UPI003676D38E